MSLEDIAVKELELLEAKVNNKKEEIRKILKSESIKLSKEEFIKFIQESGEERLHSIHSEFRLWKLSDRRYRLVSDYAMVDEKGELIISGFPTRQETFYTYKDRRPH